MARLDFFYAPEDERHLIKWILESGAVLVPHVDFPTASYVMIRDAEEFGSFRTQTSLFSILHDTFLRCPLEMSSYEQDAPKQGHYVIPREGGPSVDLSCCNVVDDDGTQFLTEGFLSYYPTYWNQEKGKNERAPKLQVRFYRQAAAHVRANSVGLNAYGVKYRVGKQAQDKRARGMKFRRVDD